jgi:hypothetical protein
MPVLSPLSCFVQQRISIDVVGKVTKTYFCPGSDDSNRSHHQAAGYHRHHSKYVLNPAADFRPHLIALLLTRGKRAVFAAFALQPLMKSPVLQQFYRLLRPIGGIGIYISTRVAFLFKPNSTKYYMFFTITDNFFYN